MSRQRKEISRDFLSSLLIKTLCFHCKGCEFDPWFSSVSLSVVSDSLQPHGLQHSSLPCPSLSPRVCSNSCPLSWWCYLTISSSVVPFSYCLQSLLASGSFPMSWLFPSSDQKYWSFSFNKSPSNEYSKLISFRIDWLDLAVQGDSRVFSSTTVQKHQFLALSLLNDPALTSVHDCWKNHSLD